MATLLDDPTGQATTQPAKPPVVPPAPTLKPASDFTSSTQAAPAQATAGDTGTPALPAAPPPIDPLAFKAPTGAAAGATSSVNPTQATMAAPQAGAPAPPPPPPPPAPASPAPLPVTPNPGFAPPGGYGTNTAGPQANGDPAAPPGFFDAYHQMEANAAAALAGGAQPNGSAGPTYRNFETGQDATPEQAAQQRTAQLTGDITAQLGGVKNLVTKENQLPGTTYGFGDPVSMSDLTKSYIDRANSPNGGANIADLIPESQKIQAHAGPTNTSGGSGYVGADGKLVFPDGTNTPWTGGGGGAAPGVAGAASFGGPADGSALGGLPSGANTPAYGASSGLAAKMQQVDPNNDLRSQQITPGDMLDRFKLAGQKFGTFSDSTNPAFLASLRDANRAAAATGRLGSGMLRTSFGDLANQRAGQLTNERDTLFQNALEGSTNDAQQNFADLLAEQQYQTGAQNQAFNQNVSGQRLQEELTGGAFNRALQQLNAGNTGNPADAQLLLSSMYGNQANQAGQGLNQMIANQAAGHGTNQDFMTMLQQYLNNQRAPTPVAQVPTGQVTPQMTLPPVRDPIPSRVEDYPENR